METGKPGLKNDSAPDFQHDLEQLLPSLPPDKYPCLGWYFGDSLSCPCTTASLSQGRWGEASLSQKGTSCWPGAGPFSLLTQWAALGRKAVHILHTHATHYTSHTTHVSHTYRTTHITPLNVYTYHTHHTPQHAHLIHITHTPHCVVVHLTPLTKVIVNPRVAESRHLFSMLTTSAPLLPSPSSLPLAEPLSPMGLPHKNAGSLSLRQQITFYCAYVPNIA